MWNFRTLSWSETIWACCGCALSGLLPYLFDVEDNEELEGADGGQQGAVVGADPADGLPVDDFQHVVRDGKLLLPPPAGQAARAVAKDHPENKRKQIGAGVEGGL